jgi:formylglycine-generating enzyme required for sulfatase activity
MREAAKGLDFLNEQHHVQHRDVKPANFLLVGGCVKVADYGLAKLLEHTVSTGTGSMTPAYAAPEFFHNQVSRWSDQYSLAATYCQLRGNRLPFEGSIAAIMAGHLTRPPDLSMLPEAERPAVARALAKKPEERWPSCRAFVEALGAGMPEPRAPRPPAVRARPAAPAGTPTSEPAPERPAKPRPPERTAPQRAGPAKQQHAPRPERDDESPSTFKNPLAPKPRRASLRERDDRVAPHWSVWPWAVLVALGVLVVFGMGLALLVRSGGKPRDTSRAEPSVPPEQAKAAEPKPPTPAAPDKEITNSIGMKLVRIPAGTFLMGSPEDDTDALDNEKPRHAVKITQDFYLGKYEVTRGQFRRFVEEAGYKTTQEQVNGGNTWKENQFYSQTDEHPVVWVDWNDARAFCNWLTKKEDRQYRLPTEAEWEYSCRTGTKSKWHNGDDPEKLADVARFGKHLADGTSPVGQYRPNRFGLYDMHGNVWEWCEDWYDERYYQNRPTTDPAGPATGSFRVIRGGSYFRAPRYCRAAHRHWFAPYTSGGPLGFRVVRVR